MAITEREVLPGIYGAIKQIGKQVDLKNNKKFPGRLEPGLTIFKAPAELQAKTHSFMQKYSGVIAQIVL